MTWRPTEATLFLEKAAAPTVNDDQNEGYLVGDFWIDETNNKSYICQDVTVGAAVWTEITQGGGLEHTQGTDTTLGVMTAGIDMNNLYQVVNLQVPSAAGEALRQTANITEADLEQLTDGSETALHIHDSRYYTEAEHLSSSAGAGDVGKPIKLDAAGHIDATMINDGDVDHTAISNIGDNSHATIDIHIADGTKHFLEGAIDHTKILSIGTNSHAQIDTCVDELTAHVADGTKHFLEGAIDHGSISGLGHSADHAWALLIDATRALTANWYTGTFNVGINDNTNTEKLNVGGNLMLSGSSAPYIKGDTKDGSNNSILYSQGAGTVGHYFVVMGTGATSLGQFRVQYGGVWGAKAIFMQHDGSDGFLSTGTGKMTLYAPSNIEVSAAKLVVDSDIIRLTTAKTPASAGATGSTGDICWDATYIYICVAANTWERVEHVGW